MNNFLLLSVNGKEIKVPVKLTEDQLKELFGSIEFDENMSGWEAPVEGATCYYEDELSRIQSLPVNETTKPHLDMLYDTVNCYSSEVIASNIARADALFRRIRRIAVERRTKPIDYSKFGGYTILYNFKTKCLECGMTGRAMSLGDIVFETESAAREVINEYAAELTWYFTEMKDSL